jgi:two-component system sensor histidine kinase KdpD
MSGDHRIDSRLPELRDGRGGEPRRSAQRQSASRLAVDAVAALGALLTGLVINYLFVPPRHELGIASGQDVVELVVLMIAAGAVSRLAATARLRAAEAERRARVAAAREREATLLAGLASGILAGVGLDAALAAAGPRIARAARATQARVVAESVPVAQPGELTQALRTSIRPAWLYISDDSDFTAEDLLRLSEPLGRLIDVAVERERAAEAAADAAASRDADALRTAVLHAISHDLRSPLTAITTAAAALRGDATPAEQGELIDVIDAEGRRLAKLVDDLLDLSKIEAGAAAPQTDWCDVREVVASALSGLKSSHPLELAMPDDLPLVRADATQLERVFVNLIENAIRHSVPDRPVSVTAAQRAGRVTVRVIDHGDGIPAGERTRIFEPFYRGRGRRGQGSGLGLAIARGFVEANGGRIAVMSATGEGSAFSVMLPVADQPEVVSSGQAGPVRTQ